jgi:hypothetical protein
MIRRCLGLTSFSEQFRPLPVKRRQKPNVTLIVHNCSSFFKAGQRCGFFAYLSLDYSLSPYQQRTMDGVSILTPAHDLINAL